MSSDRKFLIAAGIFIYLIVGFATFGYGHNHFCDPKTMADYECNTAIGSGAFLAGIGWPVYWGGKLAIEFTK